MNFPMDPPMDPNHTVAIHLPESCLVHSSESNSSGQENTPVPAKLLEPEDISKECNKSDLPFPSHSHFLAPCII